MVPAASSLMKWPMKMENSRKRWPARHPEKSQEEVEIFALAPKPVPRRSPSLRAKGITVEIGRWVAR